MATTRIDPATGILLAGGRPVFPIGLWTPRRSGAPLRTAAWMPGTRSRPPASDSSATITVWKAVGVDEQMIAVARELDAAPAHGLQLWLALAGVDNNLAHQPLLDRVVNTFKAHPGLGVWKGTDEPAHGHVPAAGCVAVYEHVKALDPHHPMVIIEAPRGPGPTPSSRDKPLTVAVVRPYAAACDVHGVDIYPIPRGAHAGGPPVNTDISVVGDMTSIIARATRRNAIWTTLQIAWSGVFPPHPVVFPTLPQARFMAYDAIVAGARGLFFFGGQFKQVINAADRARGWNWTCWANVAAPAARGADGRRPHPRPGRAVAALAVEAGRPRCGGQPARGGRFSYLIAIRKSPTTTGRVRFSGLPAGITGTVLAPGRQSPAARGGRAWRLHRPEPVRAPQRARLPLPARVTCSLGDPPSPPPRTKPSGQPLLARWSAEAQRYEPVGGAITGVGKLATGGD